MTVLYALLVELFPRRLPRDEMKAIFRDMVEDPEISRLDLAARILSDCRYLAGGVFLGTLIGSIVTLLWYVVRSLEPWQDTTAAVLSIIFLFVFAGFAGALRSGTFLGGLMVGLTAGLVSSITIAGDYFLFGHFPAPGPDILVRVVFALVLISAGAASSSGLRRLLPSTGGVRSRSPRA